MIAAFHRFNVHVAIFVAIVILVGVLIEVIIQDTGCMLGVIPILQMQWVFFVAYLFWRLVLWIRREPVAPCRWTGLMFLPTLLLGCVYLAIWIYWGKL
jgi:hypothetical protein